MSRPLLYVYVNEDNGLALVRGPNAKELCRQAEPPAGHRLGWRTVWSGSGWAVPASAVEDLRAFAKAMGRYIVVTGRPAPSRGQSRGQSRDKAPTVHPGQEALL